MARPRDIDTDRAGLLAFEANEDGERTGSYCAACWLPVDEAGRCHDLCALQWVRVNGEPRPSGRRW